MLVRYRRIKPLSSFTLISSTTSLLLLSLVPTTQASIGDRSPGYQRCLSRCITLQCDGKGKDSLSPPPIPDDDDSLLSKASFSRYKLSPLWSCQSTCSYACQQILTSLALSLSPSSSSSPPTLLEGLPLGKQVQFHGKWPFHRLDLSSTPFPLFLLDYFLPRVQEPLSVLFSLLNLFAHYRGYLKLKHLSRGGSRTREGRELSKVYLIYSLSGLNAWISSCLFHTRDLGWTEKLDYFGAGLTTLVGFWICIIRLTGWYSPSSQQSSTTSTIRRSSPKSLLTLTLTLLYLIHISYLSFRPRFNYSYNMKINLLISLLTILSWLYWIFFIQSTLPTPSNFSRRQLSSYPSARTRFRAPHHLDPLFPLLVLPLLSLLEVLDFSPIGFGIGGLRLLDSHALWHLSTVPVVVKWYDFLIKDVRWIDGQGDPPTAANAVQGTGQRSKDTPAIGTGVGGGGGFKGMESRRGRLGGGGGGKMVDFGLGLLDRYGVGLGRKKLSTTTTTTTVDTPSLLQNSSTGTSSSRND
ncbi:hypothetical protein JCM5350_003688 [Sporobolomyces pararoseus]